MKLLLEIKENKSEFVLELLKNLPFVKATQLSEIDYNKLSSSQKAAIDEGLQSLEEDSPIPHEQVMEESKKRYPDLFK